jgi:hypothetical protein
MRRCSGLKPTGGRCERIVSSEREYCYSHDPERATERKRNAARGGKAKANREISDIKGRLSTLADKVLAGDVDRADAAVAGQLLNILVGAMRVELKVREQEELLERIEVLEQAQQQTKGGGRWRT